MKVRTIALVALGVVAVRAAAHRLRPAALVTARTLRDGDDQHDVLSTNDGGEDGDGLATSSHPTNQSHGYVPSESFVCRGGGSFPA